MKAMILAAGHGERMRPLTNTVPKPLLKAGGKALIEYVIAALKAGGVTQIVVNHAHLGKQIVDYLGNGSKYGVDIAYSDESRGALETGGGIRKALPLLGEEPFIVINSDIWTDFPVASLPQHISGLAHLVLTDNPPHHPEGDFYLSDSLVNLEDGIRLTFTGIGLYSPRLFDHMVEQSFPLAPVLQKAIAQGLVTGQYYGGRWIDVGTPERLDSLDKLLSIEKPA
jgi:MurNAc alpha-1-phosphate uridylyltransferase